MTVQRLLVAVFVAVLAGGERTAWADRIERLVQILRTDPSSKVRLQAALTLAKLKDPRAAPALLQALKDASPMVRGVSAAALGALGDARAIPALKQLAQQDEHPFARTQAKKALEALSREQAAGGPAPGTRLFVTLGKMTNTAKEGGPRLAAALGEALLAEFSKVAGVATRWGGGAGAVPSSADLARRGIKGFALDGAIVSLSHAPQGGEVELSCNIKVSLATFPQHSMKAFYTGGASMSVPAGDFKPATAEGLYRELVQGAAQGARQHIVQSYLSSQ
ncbi:MAG: HEAT repeat domain-containing protein [Deltaproteobacteria bacterium]|nr:HEAT repeat domain-containing protein [Deltaproteobacteria bacterium]